MESRLLLDTHVWVWFRNADPKLTAALRLSLEQAGRHGLLYISPITVWEIALLERKRRIALAPSAWKWMQQGLAYDNVALAGLTPEIAWRSQNLPGTLHGDPADRILLATALEEKMALATGDAKMLAYAKRHRIKVV